MEKIYVNTGSRPYYIYITRKDWQPFATILNDHVRAKKLLVICDENVYPLYYPTLDDILTRHGYEHSVVIIPPGENSKSLQWAQYLYTATLDAHLDRQSSIIALGGGVVGDISGFIAATYMRGIGLIQIPTTLLAQIDSSIGGKVAVNHPAAKNIIGSFYQPHMVYINVDTLNSLPRREFAGGMAELIKYGCIWSFEFFNWIEENIESILALNTDTLMHAIHKSCEIKSRIVEADETEEDIRVILNFGHTIGHAIEAATDYKHYTHGEGVALGMVYEAKLAHCLGLIELKYVEQLIKLLKRCSLPTKLKEIDSNLIIDKMALDKKNHGDTIVFVLPTGAGTVDTFTDIDNNLLYEVLSN